MTDTPSPSEDRPMIDELAAVLADVVAKATEYGEQENGFVATYILPTGPIHRAIPLLAALGIVVRPGFDGRDPRNNPAAVSVIEDFTREMTEKVIPEIVEAAHQRHIRAAEARKIVLRTPPSGAPDIDRLIAEARKALGALWLEVHPSIAQDVTRYVDAAFHALRSSLAAAEQELSDAELTARFQSDLANQARAALASSLADTERMDLMVKHVCSITTRGADGVESVHERELPEDEEPLRDWLDDVLARAEQRHADYLAARTSPPPTTRPT